VGGIVTIRMRGALGLGIAVLLAGPSCSSEAVGERLAEEAARAAGAGDLDIDVDSDGGSVSVEGEEGSMKIGGSLPASFPDDLPLPDGYEIVASSEISGEDGDRAQVSLQTSGTADSVAEELEDAVVEAGWEVGETRRNAMDGLITISIQARRGDLAALITVTTTEGDEHVFVSYGVGPTS
jgi:hypothetical protein